MLAALLNPQVLWGSMLSVSKIAFSCAIVACRLGPSSETSRTLFSGLPAGNGLLQRRHNQIGTSKKTQEIPQQMQLPLHSRMQKSKQQSNRNRASYCLPPSVRDALQNATKSLQKNNIRNMFTNAQFDNFPLAGPHATKTFTHKLPILQWPNHMLVVAHLLVQAPCGSLSQLSTFNTG